MWHVAAKKEMLPNSILLYSCTMTMKLLLHFFLMQKVLHCKLCKLTMYTEVLEVCFFPLKTLMRERDIFGFLDVCCCAFERNLSSLHTE